MYPKPYTYSKKWTTYFLEGMVIILSILGAFALDNWNEQHKKNVLEITYLKRLHTDLTKDLYDLDTEIKNRSARFEAGKKRMLAFSGIDYQMKVDMPHKKAEMEIFVHTQYYPNDNTYQELLSTGNLNIIKNVKIKDEYSILNESWTWLEREYETINQLRLEWLIDRSNKLSNQSASQTLAMVNADSSLNITPEKSKEMSRLEIEGNLKLNEDVIFRNGVSTQVFLDEAFIAKLGKLKIQVDSLRMIIEEEIKRA